MVSSDTRLATKEDVSLSSLSHDKRLSTTRDLMKWTSRVSMATSNGPFFADAKDVFLEAQDCFGATLSKAEHRLELGIIVGAKLGITKEKVEFFCKNYKPKVHISPLSLTVGRVSLNRQQQNRCAPKQMPKFAHTRHSLVLLERVAACIQQEEPVLLVGETGTGKTSSVQNLAALCGYNLKVINMSQQSDSADLLGGFKPVEIKQLVGPVREYFEKLFCQTFSRKQNIKYLSHIQQCYAKSQWEILFKLMIHSQKAAVDRITKGKDVGKYNIQ
jgi:midasin